jgi:hypothetical protein
VPEAWHLCRAAKGTLSSGGRRGSRTLKASRKSSSRFERGAITNWLALPYDRKSCGGRNRTCVWAVNSRLPVPARVPPQLRTRSGRLDLNHGHRPAWMRVGRSCTRSTRITRLSHVLRLQTKKRPAGVEPALPPWQDGRLPLHHGRVFLITMRPNCQ